MKISRRPVLPSVPFALPTPSSFATAREPRPASASPRYSAGFSVSAPQSRAQMAVSMQVKRRRVREFPLEAFDGRLLSRSTVHRL